MILLWLACSTAPPTAPPPPAPEGIPLVKAGPLRTMLTSSADRPRIFNFWATWCGPCVAELPTFVSFAKAHPDVDVVLVNVDEAPQRPTVERFVGARLSGQHVIELDDRAPADALPGIVTDWPASIPVTLVVDRAGAKVRQYNGEVRTPDLEAGLLLATSNSFGGAPGASQTPPK